MISSYFHVIFPALKPPTALFWPQGGPPVTVGKGSSPWFMGSEETVVAPLDKGVTALCTHN